MGEIEKWSKINGFDNYQVSNLGRVRKTCNNYILKQQDNGKGYKKIAIRVNNKIKNIYVHRIVAIVFCENINNKKIVDHINGIRDDNRAENLRWCTTKENVNFELAKENHSKSLKIAMNRVETKKKLSISMKKVFSDPCIIKKMSYSCKKNWEEGKYNNEKKRVIRLSENGSIDKIYDSLSSLKNDGFDSSYICKVCKGKKEFAYGYKWEYIDMVH